MYHTTKRESAHDDSAWSVVWTSDDKIISGSIDETVKVGVRCFLPESSSMTLLFVIYNELREECLCLSHSERRQLLVKTHIGAVVQVWKPLGDIDGKPPTLEFWDVYKEHFLGVVSMSPSA